MEGFDGNYDIHPSEMDYGYGSTALDDGDIEVERHVKLAASLWNFDALKCLSDGMAYHIQSLY